MFGARLRFCIPPPPSGTRNLGCWPSSRGFLSERPIAHDFSFRDACSVAGEGVPVYFTPRGLFCAGGGESESGDLDAGPGALPKARGQLQANAEQYAFAMAHYEAGWHASQPWLLRPDPQSLMGDRGAALSNWVVRVRFSRDPLTQYGR